ncbi:membrane-associated oxidoreductase [Streptomyces sp. NPDC060194]|uniref:membrane-associated oxidoreductase n=1 Tax=Streptomyces sp. NPDC060194 TaxID=3347069 RepID=UPI003662C351
MEMDNLTAVERRVADAYAVAASLDLRVPDPDTGAPERPEDGGGWGPERTVRASVIRELLLSRPAEDGRIPGLRIAGIRITGCLRLPYGGVDCEASFLDCHFEEAPNLYGARIRQLGFPGSFLPGLVAATIRVDGVLRLTDCRVPGPVRLGGAQITGAVFMDGAHIGTEAADEPVLLLNHAQLGGDLWAPKLVVEGEARMEGASVTGSVNLREAAFSRPGGTALHADALAVGIDLNAWRLRSEGHIDLRGARVPGRLVLSNARLSHPDGYALRASSTVVGELWMRETRIAGAVNLRRSQIEVVHVPSDVWPDRLRLDGLTYTALDPAEPATARLPMLERDPRGYVPHAYEQLTAAYRRIGDDASARTVQLAKQRRHRATLVRYARAWGWVQDATVGYGFRPMRAAGWLFSLLLAGSLAFAVDRPRALKPEESPDFSPVFYALDLLLPIIDFGQERAYTPEGWTQGLAYLLIIAGWILATTVVAGVTRTVSRQ